MSSTSRAKKKQRAASLAQRRDAFELLTGEGETLWDVYQRACDAVHRLSGVHPLSGSNDKSGERDEDPWLPSARDGSGRRLRRSWEHLRSVLPDINLRHAWTRRDFWRHRLIILLELHRRKRSGSAMYVSFFTEHGRDDETMEETLVRLVSGP